MLEHKETIAAISTPTGRAGIGAIRVSGKNSKKIYQALTGSKPEHKRAQYVSFVSSSSEIIDKGVSLFFKGPSSYTGEDVMECFTHGSRFILDALLQEIIVLGARPASPGEFTQRAFLNGKIDLIQAEAVADLIDSNSKIAARSALQSMQGVFSDKIFALKAKIIETRALIEAMLDFPDEEGTEIDAVPAINNIKWCINSINQLLAKTKTGRMLNKAPTIAIVGKPNAGKSTLINFLSGANPAIVSNTPGTTRDLIREPVLLREQPAVLVDTAGIQNTDNPIEQEGVDRTFKMLEQADLILCLVDIGADDQGIQEQIKDAASDIDCIFVKNKIDLYKNIEADDTTTNSELVISAKTGEGIERLIDKICSLLNLTGEEDIIFARQRHIDALSRIQAHMKEALTNIDEKAGMEIVAESFRRSLHEFDTVIGKTTTDDILENIFSRFCIGK